MKIGPFFLLCFIAGLSPHVQADDFSLSTAGAPKAPADAEQAKKDPFIALTSKQRHEIAREFRALLSMGTQSWASSRWPGNDIADCQNLASEDGSCRKCDVQMGSSRGDYLFYKSGSQCRLRDIEVTVDSADKVLLKELKPHANYFAGSRNGQFYLDEDEHSGQSNLRFVWKRPG